MIMDMKDRTRLAKLLNMLRSPVADEREAAVANINLLMTNFDWETLLAAQAGGIWSLPMYNPKPVFRPMTPEEKDLVGEMLQYSTVQHWYDRWLSNSDRKRLRAWLKRGTITEAHDRDLHKSGGFKWRFENAKQKAAEKGAVK